MNFTSKILKFTFSIFDKFLFLFLFAFLFFIYNIRITPPIVDETLTPDNYKRITVAKDHYKVKNNWLKKNEFGVWEMYLEGSPYERGLIYGVLAKEIIASQELSFVNQINELIPSQFFQRFLQVFIAWLNRDMDSYVNKENLAEIYGISKSFSNEYDYIGPKFYRILYYHAAHDIGHALADLRIVGCTSFSAKGSYTTDGELLIGRNFDFYMGEEFAKDKLIIFVKPDSGYNFSSYSWAGFTGVVSGMNDQGLTVTLNAATSDVPIKAKEPISLLAREILQYAKNIEEAVAIAKNRETFVSESLFIGSANDNNTTIIEKSPSKTDVFFENKEVVVCANHYQSELHKNDKSNLDNIEMSDSKFRFSRMESLISNYKPLDVFSTATILRDRKGANNENIGLGNPQSINQLIAYHAVIFKPKAKKIWISTYPYQLGKFICYDLNDVFNFPKHTQHIGSLTIEDDPFLKTAEFDKYLNYKKTKEKIVKHVMFGRELTLSDADIKNFIAANPESYESYFNIARYYEAQEDYCKAKEMYSLTLTKVIASKAEEISITKQLNDIKILCK